ncbi:DUF805 domain-containing protein [Qipengyuania flava]|nr:DUF805 domain-containing protein [Qipengyuania flava]
MINEDTLKSIEKLHSMKAQGVISEDDFEEAKRKLLDGRAPARTVSASRTDYFTATTVDGHLEWMLRPLKRYADFNGRSPRREFWMFMLLTNLVAAVLTMVFLGDTNFLGRTGTLGNLAFGILILGLLGVIIPYLAVQARRFHDQGRSGWFAALNLIPFIGVFIALGFMLVPGDQGENDYGPDPYA